MTSADFTVETQGRTLNGWLGGAPGGMALVFQPGTPAPPVRWSSLDRLATRMGLRLINYARPGYSGSTRMAGRSVADAAPDVLSIIDHLGIGEFMTIGHSGGGPHAFACAALIPDRCLAASTIGSVAPFEGLKERWTAGMAPENIEEFGMAIKGESELRPMISAELAARAEVTAEEVAEALGELLSPVDQAAMTGEMADLAARWYRQAAIDGADGWMDDDLAFVNPWGFDPADIAVPVAIWHGGHDMMVPSAHGVWLDERIATSRPRLLDDEGHMSLLTRRLGDIVEDVRELARIGEV